MRRFVPRLAGAALIGALICVMVWLQWYSVTSDIPYFAPPEWSWMDGAVDLKTAEKTGHLLIRRELTREPTHSNGYYSQMPYWEQFLRNRDQSWERKRRREKDAAPISGIKHSRDLEAEYCYEYDPATRKLEGVSCSLWNEENGSVSPCSPLRFSKQYYKLGERSMSNNDIRQNLSTALTIGKSIQQWCVTPSVPACSRDVGTTSEPADRCPARLQQADRVTPQRAFAAVLSARPPMPTLSLTGSGFRRSGSRSQHYHQIMRLSDSSIVGSRVRLPIVTRLGDDIASPGRDMLMGMGWSPDERFVVYTGRTSLCIVHVDE